MLNKYTESEMITGPFLSLFEVYNDLHDDERNWVVKYRESREIAQRFFEWEDACTFAIDEYKKERAA